MRLKKSDRRALLLIFVVVVVAWSAVLIDRQFRSHNESSLTWAAFSADSAALDSIYARRQESYSEKYEKDRYDAIPERTIETFPFDPNTADSTAFLRLGLAPWQVRSIYKFRAHGGRYHRIEDFQRVPGMTPETWNRLAKVMQIGEAFRYYHQERDSSRFQKKDHDSVCFPHQEKYTEIVQLDLNTTDSTALKKIPGIASVRARQILRYREQLGGFVSLEQLSEIEGLPAGIEQWFKVEAGVFRPLLINEASASVLARHPYLGYTQAKAIVTYRRNYGRIKSLSELRLLPEFTEADFARLEPYVKY